MPTPFPRCVIDNLLVCCIVQPLINPCDSQGARPTHAETSVTSVEEHMRGTAMGWRLWRRHVRSVLDCTLWCSLPSAFLLVINENTFGVSCRIPMRVDAVASNLFWKRLHWIIAGYANNSPPNPIAYLTYLSIFCQSDPLLFLGLWG